MAEAQIKITADTSQAEREIRRLENALSAIDELSASTAIALGIFTAAAAGVGLALEKTLQSAGEMLDVTEALNISITSLQGLEFAAANAGISSEKFTASLMKMSATLGGALASGSGSAYDAIEKLGLNLNKLVAMRADKQFELITARILEIKNPTEQAAMAVEIFGKSGLKILQVAKNADEAKASLAAMGLTLSTMDQATLAIMDKQADELAGIINNAWKKALVEVAPLFIAIVEYIKDAIKEAGGFEVILKKVGAALKTALNIALITLAIVGFVQLVGFALRLVVAIREAGVVMGIFNTIVKRSPLFLLAIAAGYLADKIGIDVVGALGDATGMNEQFAKITDDIAAKEKEISDKLAEQNAESDALNKKQLDYLKALDKTIAGKATDVQYQKDLIALGDSEANIRKALNAEDIKAREAGLALSNQQYQTKRAELEENLRLEDSLKRQNELTKFIGSSIRDAANSISPLIKELDKQFELELIINKGKSQAEAKQFIEDLYSGQSDNGQQLLQLQENVIQRTINAEIGKHDKILALDIDYSNKLRALNAISAQDAAKNIQLDEIQTQQLNEAKLKLTSEYLAQRNLLEAQAELDSLTLATQNVTKLGEIRLQISQAEYNNQLAMNNLQIQQEMAKFQTLEQLEVEHQSKLSQIRMEAALKAGTADYQIRKVGAQEAAQITTERANFEKKTELEKSAFLIDQTAQMMTSLGSYNKKAFEAAKAFNIANAVMNTYMGATKALATYPPPFNFVAAAAVVAMGLAQVASIRSQQYSGRALGGPVMGNTPYLVGENGPEIFTPNTTGSITRNQDIGGGGGSTNVNFTIVANDTAGFDQLLTQRKGLITQIIRDAQLDRGMKSGY